VKVGVVEEVVVVADLLDELEFLSAFLASGVLQLMQVLEQLHKHFQTKSIFFNSCVLITCYLYSLLYMKMQNAECNVSALLLSFLQTLGK